jgi:hypothetical protein
LKPVQTWLVNVKVTSADAAETNAAAANVEAATTYRAARDEGFIKSLIFLAFRVGDAVAAVQLTTPQCESNFPRSAPSMRWSPLRSP